MGGGRLQVGYKMRWRQTGSKGIGDNHRLMANAAVPSILTNPLQTHIARAVRQAGGWLSFDSFMTLALYSPGLGYYANTSQKFGLMPGGANRTDQSSRSDFVTAPEMTPLFAQSLATQVAQALRETATSEICEFGAGSGALARDLLGELAQLGVAVSRYTIVDLSGVLRERQQTVLQHHGATVRWADELPPSVQGVIIGNEVLDAMPVKLLARSSGVWRERGVAISESPEAAGTDVLMWADQDTSLHPPLEIEGTHDYVTEIHHQAEAFIRTLADKLARGAIFLIDYGFPEAEYYHVQRHMGSVMCHQAHRSDTNPLVDVGLKDITAHVNFTGIALAGQDAGLDVLGYCTQARFLMNCGLLQRLERAPLTDKVMAQKLILEHEMGELFKVIGFSKPTQEPWQALGFAQGDRTHTL